MRKILLTFLSTILIVILGLLNLTGCGDASSTNPQKLSAPIVTLNGNVATWEGGLNVDKFEISIDGNLSYVENTVTSKTLLDGQTFKIRAVGNGINYATSDWSNSVTYTANNTTQTNAPTYLGIFASNDEPKQENGLPDTLAIRPATTYQLTRLGSYRTFEKAIGEYYENSENYLESTLPPSFDSEVFSKAGETVYIQIWLNNPLQHTILSLKLNSTKYQVGGSLYSFFIEDGNERYNCIYVAVTIPNDSYEKQTYKVSDIEYIANTYINADGTDKFMNDNDTVTIGLPYKAQKPTISNFDISAITVNSFSATFTVTDANGLSSLSGGWLGVAVYDGQNIIKNQKIVIGNNTLNPIGLIENTWYWVTVYLYADLHDGKGVSAHKLFEQTITTAKSITVEEVKGTLLYNSQKDGYYGAIKVNTVLNSNTAEYVRLEILKGDEIVYTDTNYNGTATVSSGILCGESYAVRVYYKDNEYPEGKYVEEGAWVNYLGNPWYQDAGGYAFVNDVVYYFQLNNNDENYPMIDSFTLKLYNEESPRWVASDVLYILEHPTAIDDLNAQIDALFDQMSEMPRGEEMNAVYNQIQELRAILSPLEHAKWYLESRANNNTNVSYWQAEASKGKYFYEFEYNGTNTENLFKVDKTYYVVLKDAFDSGCKGFDVQIDYKYDKQEGGDLAEGVVRESFNILMLNYFNGTEVRNVNLNGNSLTFSLVNVDHYPNSNGNGETTYDVGYVYKICARNENWELVEIYNNNSNPQINVNEESWLAEYIRRVKANESTDDLYDTFVPKYKNSYTVTLNLSEINAEIDNIIIYTRIMTDKYQDGEYDRELYVNVSN